MDSVFQSGLFQNTVQCASRDVNAGMPRDGDDAGFVRMLEMPMTAARARQMPTVFFDEFDGFTDFH